MTYPELDIAIVAALSTRFQGHPNAAGVLHVARPYLERAFAAVEAQNFLLHTTVEKLQAEYDWMVAALVAEIDRRDAVLIDIATGGHSRAHEVRAVAQDFLDQTRKVAA